MIVAGVQTDCRLGDIAGNLQTVLAKLHAAADRGAKLVVFPECVLTGYGFATREAAETAARPVPGPETDAIAKVCKGRGVFAVVGLIEADGAKLYNAAAILGPDGLVGVYRKVHLPCVGADRFLDPGDRPFAVYDVAGLKLGVGICFDASFPESIRVLTLLGADAVALPTNWATAAAKMANLVARVRALENNIYFIAVNRVGHEAGFDYIGHGSVVAPNGDFLVQAAHDRDDIFLAEIDPQAARRKRVVHCAGEYEIDRVNWRRPEFYGKLTERPADGFSGRHHGG